MLSSLLLYCYSQEDRVTPPRSEEGYGRAGPGLLLWQALSKQCRAVPLDLPAWKELAAISL